MLVGLRDKVLALWLMLPRQIASAKKVDTDSNSGNNIRVNDPSTKSSVISRTRKPNSLILVVVLETTDTKNI